MVKGNKGKAPGFCYGEFKSFLKQIHKLLFNRSQFNFMEEGAVWNCISRNPHKPGKARVVICQALLLTGLGKSLFQAYFSFLVCEIFCVHLQSHLREMR